MPTFPLRATAAAIAALAMASLAGCAGADSGAGVGTADDAGLRVVASTDVYGDIAFAVGGNLVTVTSIIENPAQDPHSYEGTARVQLELSRADVVIDNGGGYDDFVGTLLAGAGNDKAARITATALFDATDADTAAEAPANANAPANEHVWYDLGTMRRVAEALADEFSAQDSAHAEEYAANASEFAAGIATLEQRAGEVRAEVGTGSGNNQGASAVSSEPVPLFLLAECGIVDRTPVKFAEAIEAESDVAPLALAETLALVRERGVAMVAYNEQTSGAATARLVEQAKESGVPVVTFTETLPEGDTYLEWMAANIDAIASALAESRS